MSWVYEKKLKDDREIMELETKVECLNFHELDRSVDEEYKIKVKHLE